MDHFGATSKLLGPLLGPFLGGLGGRLGLDFEASWGYLGAKILQIEQAVDSATTIGHIMALGKSGAYANFWNEMLELMFCFSDMKVSRGQVVWQVGFHIEPGWACAEPRGPEMAAPRPL